MADSFDMRGVNAALATDFSSTDESVAAILCRVPGAPGPLLIEAPRAARVAGLVKAAISEAKLSIAPQNVALWEMKDGVKVKRLELLQGIGSLNGATVVLELIGGGTMPFNPSLGIDKDLWEVMSQDAQEQVPRVVDVRQRLASVAMLREMSANMTVEDAKRNGVTVLHAADGKVLLGVFDVPAVDDKVSAGPKGFVLKQTRHYYLPERALYVSQLLRSIVANQDKLDYSGVLLTGPNGVGKSAVGVLAFLCCLAQGRFAVYIPDAKEWVAAAEAGRGDEFLLERFFMQNVDKIAATPKLRVVFDGRFRGVTINTAVMEAFRAALITRPGPAVAVIVDEVQNITQAIGRADVPGATTAVQTAGSYFRNGWSTWNTANRCFVRMDIASSHGTRELKLPSGDGDRLRFVRPWPLQAAAVALEEKASPAFVTQKDAHSRILDIAGGVIRQLLRCKAILPAGQVTAAGLAGMEHDMREAMKADCGHWLRTQLDDAGRRDVARSIVPLFRGQVTWAMVKGAYDEGLVALAGVGKQVSPVSPVAASVLHQQLAAVLRVGPSSLSSIHGDAERGYELERQVHACLDPCNVSIETVRLNGDQGLAIHVRTDYMLPFHDAKDTVAAAGASTLYIPDRDNFDCDAIVVPAAPAPAAAVVTSNAAAAGGTCGTTPRAVAAPGSTATTLPVITDPVLVWECSVTDPRDSDRVEKVDGWFKDGGLIASLRAAHPSRPIVVVFCWPGKVDKSGHRNYKALEERATAMSVALCVVDGSSLLKLGVVL